MIFDKELTSKMFAMHKRTIAMARSDRRIGAQAVHTSVIVLDVLEQCFPELGRIDVTYIDGEWDITYNKGDTHCMSSGVGAAQLSDELLYQASIILEGDANEDCAVCTDIQAAT